MVERDWGQASWLRLVEDPRRALDVLLDALRDGTELWVSITVAALDLVPDEDLPQLVEAVIARLPAELAADLGILLGLQVPELMREHAEAMRAADPYFELGSESRAGERSLVLLPAHHLVLPEEAVTARALYAVSLPTRTPTWAPRGEPVGTAAIGGEAPGECATCGGPLHVLLELSALPALGEVELPSLLVTCGRFDCLWGEQFFEHRDAGPPRSLARAPRVEAGSGDPWSSMPTHPLPSALPVMKVAVHRTPARWQFQDWAQANDMQNLNRLGGEGTWIQGARHPECPGCGLTMPLLAQFDGATPFVEGPGWGAFTEGILYCYWCVDCRVSATATQQT